MLKKIIKHYIQLGVDPYIVGDIMLFNIEVALRYTKENSTKQSSFYTSMLKSYQEAILFITEKGLSPDFVVRIKSISSESKKQDWPNSYTFEGTVI